MHAALAQHEHPGKLYSYGINAKIHSTIVGYTSIVYMHCLDLRQSEVGRCHPVRDSAC